MEHLLAKTILIRKVIELIAKYESISINEARDKLYSSDVINLLDDDETGLYGESPLYIYSIYENLKKKTKYFSLFFDDRCNN